MGKFGEEIPKQNPGVSAQREFIYQNRYAVLFSLWMLYDKNYSSIDKILTEYHEDIILSGKEGVSIIQIKTNPMHFQLMMKKL